MDKFGSANEVLNFAIEQEIAANRFYLDLAQKSAIPAMQEVFESFAREEQGHQAKLEALKRKGGLAEHTEPEEVQELGIADYIVDVEPTADMDYKDALILAMKKEKAAYRLYLDLASVAQSEELTDTFMWLAQEEAKHKLRFEIEYDDIVLKED
jgi:rubrerythrin